MLRIKKYWNSSEEEKKIVGNTELKSIFDEHYNRLVYFAFQFVKNKQQAQDLAQEAFIKYWDNRTNVFTDECAIKNYLYSTVKNLSLNVIRHNRVVDSYVASQQNNEPTDLPIIHALITAEVIAEIHLAIQSLPENYRIVSLKGFLEGKKNQEIADELGMSVNTVKKQKQKAIQLLRLKLNPDLLLLLIWLAK